MQIGVSADDVYDADRVPTYSWETYQRGFLGILNNAYNQSCNNRTPTLGHMNDIENDFVDEHGTGSWQDFVRFYVRQYDGHDRIRSAIDAMAQNIQDRVASVGGAVPADRARFWARKYIWSMLTNTYSGFCSERTAIEVVAYGLDVPYDTDGDEPAGIDGTIGSATVQVKPASYMGLDLNDHEADYVIEYELDEDTFVFDVPADLTPQA